MAERDQPAVIELTEVVLMGKLQAIGLLLCKPVLVGSLLNVLPSPANVCLRIFKVLGKLETKQAELG